MAGLKVKRTRYVGRLGQLVTPMAAKPFWGVRLNRYYHTDVSTPTETLGIVLGWGCRRYLSWVWPIRRVADGEVDG